ncbi:MAG TPA: succinyl-diaminopimelate desuccinylase [Pseudomonadales bacterium]|nr:succinyl-diaminopimelate desuccinylase [Pseudomonadales bacterium]
MPQDLDQATLDLAKQLISNESVSPEDGGCQQLLADYLDALGFSIEPMPFGDVKNLWATHGAGTPRLVFAGHTDVVPTGPPAEWSTPPFEPHIQDNMLYGRGAADMKGSIAAMMTAASRFIAARPNHIGSLAFLITSDEEDRAVDGTRKVVEELVRRGDEITWCLVGEPSSSTVLGDVIRIGRRGSLSARLVIHGVQGHVAYPQDARNPIHLGMPALAELTGMEWDKGNNQFPPTTMQISNIHAGTGAGNVIPGDMDLTFNFRFSTESTAEALQQRTTELLDRYELDYDIKWNLSGIPFLTTATTLIDATRDAIAEVTGVDTTLSTSGGTSDGRFIAPTGAEVVELGPCNATIHKINECVDIGELTQLSQVYSAIMDRLLPDA